jgi:hypothetical protein
LLIFFISETGQIMRRTKCQSGNEKKKKRQRLEAAAQSQKGALDKFVVKEHLTIALFFLFSNAF